MYTWDDLDVAFIVSTGRTGTQKLAGIFSKVCDRVDSRHEPSPDMFDLGTDYARGRIPFKRALGDFLAARDHICSEVHAAGLDYYIESNNNLGLLIPVMRGPFGRRKIIHVVRDGRDFVRSAYSKTVPSATSGGVKGLFLTDEDPRPRLQAPDFAEDPYGERWNRMSRFEKLCWLWVKLDGMICHAIAGDPMAITVKFEDIFDEGRGYRGLWDIVEFLGLHARMTVGPERVHKLMSVKENRTERYLIPRWPEWTSVQMEQFQQIAGEHMGMHGYQL
jgi:hypothetical protein